MPRKSLRYYLFNEIMLADDNWFDDDPRYRAKESTGERGEEYFDYLAKKAARMLKKEGFVK